jgi:hypothetical protein
VPRSTVQAVDLRTFLPFAKYNSRQTASPQKE